MPATGVIRDTPFAPAPLAARLLVVLACATLAACAAMARKDAEESVKNTFACELGGERLVIKFEADEARLLMPGGDRVNLYRIAAASGVRYTNGVIELRGKGMELELVRNDVANPLAGCAPVPVPN